MATSLFTELPAKSRSMYGQQSKSSYGQQSRIAPVTQSRVTPRQGGVLGASASITQSSSRPAQSSTFNAPQPYESDPDGPDLDSVNSTFAPAINALNQFQSSLQAQLSGQAPLMGEDQLRSEADATRSTLQSGLTEKKQAYAGQRTREEGRTQSVVAEARRQGSELIQGLQSKFGGSTGTGAFVGELAGRQVLQNVAQNRAALQDTLMQINDAEVSMEREVARQMEGLDMRLQASVQELRNNLMQQIQEVNIKRGELESNKARAKVDLLNQFRQQKAEVEARNAQFRQQLYMEFQSRKQQAQELKGMTVQQFEALLQNPSFSQFNPEFGINDQGRVSGLRFTPREEQKKENQLMTIPGGSTLFDPTQGRAVYTAPKVSEFSSEEDY